MSHFVGPLTQHKVSFAYKNYIFTFYYPITFVSIGNVELILRHHAFVFKLHLGVSFLLSQRHFLYNNVNYAYSTHVFYVKIKIIIRQTSTREGRNHDDSAVIIEFENEAKHKRT